MILNREDALQIIKDTKTDYDQKQRIVRGLQIIAKYDDGLDFRIAFEHDIMYASSFDSTVEEMTKEEVTEMSILGWFMEEDSWTHF